VSTVPDVRLAEALTHYRQARRSGPHRAYLVRHHYAHVPEFWELSGEIDRLEGEAVDKGNGGEAWWEWLAGVALYFVMLFCLLAACVAVGMVLELRREIHAPLHSRPADRAVPAEPGR
jgi:hypothetical protein